MGYALGYGGMRVFVLAGSNHLLSPMRKGAYTRKQRPWGQADNLRFASKAAGRQNLKLRLFMLGCCDYNIPL